MTGSSRLFAVPGWKLALGLELVAQVVQRVVLAVRLGADGGAGGGDQVVEVGQGPGQPRAEPAHLGGQQRNQVQRPGERTQGRDRGVVPAGGLVKIGVGVVPGFGRDGSPPLAGAVSPDPTGHE